MRLALSIALLMLPASFLHAAVESELHKQLAKSNYYDFIQRNPEAFVRHRLALISPEKARELRGSTFEQALGRFFRSLPAPSLSVGIGVVSVDFSIENVAELRNAFARASFGPGGLAPDLKPILRSYIETHPHEVEATFDAVYDISRTDTLILHSKQFTVEQIGLLRSEVDADADADPAYTHPKEELAVQLSKASPAFQRAMQVLDQEKTAAEIDALKNNDEALLAFLQDKLRSPLDGEEMKKLLTKVAGEMTDVRAFVAAQRAAEERQRLVQEIHSAVDILATIAGFADPAGARKFATIAHQTINAVNVVATAGALTLTGVGAVLAAGVVIAQVLSDPGISEIEQLQGFILEIYRDVMRELADIKRGLFEIRTQLAAIDARIATLALDTSIGFASLQLALRDTQATLAGLALESELFFEVQAMDKAEDGHNNVVDLMTNPAQEEQRASLIAEPGGSQGLAVQQNLAAIAKLGLIDSKQAPFSVATQPLHGDQVEKTPRGQVVENRVADLAPLAARLATLAGASPRLGRLSAVPHSMALAQSVALFVDARDRLPRPAARDANFGLLCTEVRRVAMAAEEARALTPFALRALSSAARRLVDTANAMKRENPPDRDVVANTAAVPLPQDPNLRIDLALAGGGAGGTAVEKWVVTQPVQVALRPATAAERAQFDPPLAQDAKIADLEGCAVAERVVFDAEPRVVTDSFGIKNFEGATRLIVRERRRLCAADHPVIAFPTDAFGSGIEKRLDEARRSLPEEALSDAEKAANEASLRRITDTLARKRGTELANRARDTNVITVPAPRRVRRLRIIRDNEPQPGRPGQPTFLVFFVGCIEFHTEGFWTDEARGLDNTVPQKAWTFAIQRVCTGGGDFRTAEAVEEFVEAERQRGAGTFIEVPLETINADLARLDRTLSLVHDKRATLALDDWKKASENAVVGNPLGIAIDELRLARYAFETFARFGFGSCIDANGLFEPLLLVTCAGSPACELPPPDKELENPRTFVVLADALAAVEKVAALGTLVPAVEAAAATPNASCSEFGPFGFATAAELLNGIARASSVFLPEGCPF